MITNLTAYHEHEQGYMDCANGLPIPVNASKSYIEGHYERLLFELGQAEDLEARDQAFSDWGLDLIAQSDSSSVSLKTYA